MNTSQSGKPPSRPQREARQDTAPTAGRSPAAPVAHPSGGTFPGSQANLADAAPRVPKPWEGHRERLRQRYDKAGYAGFAEHEILEFLLTYAIPKVDVKPQAKALLARFKDLPGVFAARRAELMRVPGIGPYSARFLHALRDAASHMLRQKSFGERKPVNSAAEVVPYLSSIMVNLPEERFHVVYFDQANVIIADETLSHGVEDQTAVYPRLVMKRTLAHHATGFLVAHNHPTGHLAPSQADRDITRALDQAAKTLDLRFLDHLILGREGKGYFSFREHGLLT